MPNITRLDQSTINKIAAGEVVERPASVVKELLENAIDAKATAVTVEIKDGGISLVRVTDNGCGIPREEIPLAFLRHATSKIQTVEDLFCISSLGFRGEALASIAAVSQVELITKPSDSLIGFHYRIEGGIEKSLEEAGVPAGTTFIAKNLFFNTPARRKFLKTPAAEGAHVAELVEKIAMSHPEVSIRFIQNNQNKLYTSGNNQIKDIIYTIFGRETAGNLLPVDAHTEDIAVTGFIGNPTIARNSRNVENYFINGRYIKSTILLKAVEEAYKPFLMQHKYPFVLLYFTIKPDFLDINVHPTKMELRFQDGEQLFKLVYNAVSYALSQKELIPQVRLNRSDSPAKKKTSSSHSEPFEKNRMGLYEQTLKQLTSMPEDCFIREDEAEKSKDKPTGGKKLNPLRSEINASVNQEDSFSLPEEDHPQQTKQLELFSDKFLGEEARKQHRIIGQLFHTYWLVEYNQQLFIIDQHAAHEKILFEQIMNSLKTREFGTQIVNPPIILTLSRTEEVLMKTYMEYFCGIGFEIEHFGGREYAVRGIPANLFSLAKKELFLEMLDGLTDDIPEKNSRIIYEKVASMSCKAAVKGNHALSEKEADALIDQLLAAENPYTCPHGRPTIIAMSKHELEKKFKRIV